MNILSPDPGLLFWMVLSFAIVFFLLWKFGFPVIVDAIDIAEKIVGEKMASDTEQKKAIERLIDNL